MLDTDTGNTVFTYADVGDEGYIRFIGNKLAFYRTFGRPRCTTPPGEAYDRRR